VEEKKIRFKNIDVHYRCFGNGETVMLVHGFAESGIVWNEIAHRLSSQYRVLVPDLPGSGESKGVLTAFEHLHEFADCLKAILDAEQIERLTLIGHSMGGYISMAFWSIYESRLNGVGLFHSTAMGDHEEKQRNRERYIKFMQTHGAEAFLNASIPGLFADPEKHSTTIQKHIEIALLNGVDNLIRYYQLMKNREDRTCLFSQTDLPVLMVCGKEDHTIPVAQNLLEAKLPNQCHLHILKHSAHMGMIEEPEPTFDILSFFLDHIHSSH
jgi:pimeloyl-ACP methyl ester carboxylesterase